MSALSGSPVGGALLGLAFVKSGAGRLVGSEVVRALHIIAPISPATAVSAMLRSSRLRRRWWFAVAVVLRARFALARAVGVVRRPCEGCGRGAVLVLIAASSTPR